MALMLDSLCRTAGASLFGHFEAIVGDAYPRHLTVVRDFQMCNQNEWIVREAFLAYDRGDVARMLDFVDPDLERTYLDPGLGNPEWRIQELHPPSADMRQDGAHLRWATARGRATRGKALWKPNITVDT